MNSSDKPKEYLSSSEVGSELGIPLRQVRELCKWGKLPKAIQPYKNGPWLIPPQALADFKKHNRNKTVTSLDKFSYVLFGNKIKAFFSTLFVVLGLLFGAISAGADIGGARQQLIEWGIVSAFPKADEDETLIVIAAFRNTEGIPDTEPHKEIQRSIIRTADSLGISNLRVEILPVKLASEDKAKAEKFATQYKASMIIWGENSGVRVTVDFLFTDKSKEASGSISETDRT